MGNYDVDLAGQRFGRLTAIEPMTNKHGNRDWRCRCECGNMTHPSTHALTHGRATSCGCANRERRSALNTTHGMSNTPEHRSWKAMRNRCHNPRGQDYPDYGGRGVTVCDRWRGTGGFANFHADMGPRPPGASIDRIDNDGNYSPQNCRWATSQQQARNKRTNVSLTHNGVTMLQEDWAQTLKLSPSALTSRRRRKGSAF